MYIVGLGYGPAEPTASKFRFVRIKENIVRLCIQTHGIDLTEAIKRQAYQKLELALDRLEEQVTRISVYLIDTNGPFLGGIDKACRIVVQIENQESLVVEDCDASVPVVIERITDRLGVVACQRFETLYGKRRRIQERRTADKQNPRKTGFEKNEFF
jgi:ribosome-associated translation inhibitor RaiA